MVGNRLRREHADRPSHRPLHRGRHCCKGQTENEILLPHADAGAIRQRRTAKAPREARADEKGDALGVLEGIHRLRLCGCARQAVRSRLRHRTFRTVAEEAKPEEDPLPRPSPLLHLGTSCPRRAHEADPGMARTQRYEHNGEYL